MSEPKKRWMLYCEPCSFKKLILDELPTMPGHRLSDIPNANGMQRIDPDTNMVVPIESRPQPKMFKCPKCGRGVVLRPLPDSYVKTVESREAALERDRLRQEQQQRIIDGTSTLDPKKPESMPVPQKPEFLG